MINMDELKQKFDIRKAQEDYFSTRIKRYASYSTRASSIGYFIPELAGCIRRGVYERLNWREKQLYDVQSYIRFEEGNRQEDLVLRDMMEWGYKIIKQQTPFHWKKQNITGTIDGVIVIDNYEVPMDIKSMSPMVFQTVSVYEDLNKKPWLRSYKAQITLYMMHHEMEVGILICKDKSSGTIKPIFVQLDYELGEYCLKTAEKIEEHVKNETYPDKILDWETCKNCPFNHICKPEIEFGSPLKISEDVFFNENLQHYMENKQIKKDIEHMWNDILRPQILQEADENGTINLVAGKYHISGKQDAKKAIRTKITLIGCDDEM